MTAEQIAQLSPPVCAVLSPQNVLGIGQGNNSYACIGIIVPCAEAIAPVALAEADAHCFTHMSR